jgi:hypothetical protein
VEKVADVLHREVVLGRGVTTIWGGGDPCFRFSKRGGNVADVARALHRLSTDESEGKHRLVIAAVQREDYAAKVPAFEQVVVGYHASLAQVGGRPTFGGFETDGSAVPSAYRDFLDALRGESAAGNTSKATGRKRKSEREEEKKEVGEGEEAEPEAENKGKETQATGEPKKNRISGQFLPPAGVYPMAASAGYLSLLPALLGARTAFPSPRSLVLAH